MLVLGDRSPSANGGDGMRAVTVVPGVAGSLRVEEGPEPGSGSGSVLVEALAVGVCGTDAEIASGRYGWAPPGRDRLILGHESLGRVVDPGPSGFRSANTWWGSSAGPTRCPARTARSASGTCAPTAVHRAGHQAGRWVHGRALAIEPDYAVRVDKHLGCSGCCWSRPRWSPRPGSTSGHRSAQLLGSAHRPGHRGRAHRPARRSDRHAAGRRGPRARPGHQRPQTGPGHPAGRDLPHRGDR